jgi:hypothetical protein
VRPPLATEHSDFEPSGGVAAGRPRRRALNRAAGWIAGALAIVCFLAALWNDSFPPPPSRITLEVTFPPGLANQCEPIITTGVPGDGDFLAVRYLDQQRAVLLYDVWGIGGPTSKPFTLRPGERRKFSIELPTLVPVSHVRSREKRPLYVALDGEVLFDEPAYFHRRRPKEIFFAVNPIGGSLVRANFRGTLALADGPTLHGGPEQLFAWTERLNWMIRFRAGAIAARTFISVGIGFAAAWLIPWLASVRWSEFRASNRAPTLFPIRTNPPHGWFLATSAVCTLAFVSVMTGGTFRLIHPESFGHFYDYQALSFMQGRLDLPEPAHSSESFIFEGKHYLYFGPTPAVLRLPFVALNLAFGQLSRSFMLAYYVAFLAAAYAVLLHVSQLAGGNRHRPSRLAVVVFISAIGMGSTLFFLGSRAYIYHEAILCGAMFTLWSAYFSLRYIAEPTWRASIPAVALGIAAVHARPPCGLFALSLIGCAALLVAWQRRVVFTDSTIAVRGSFSARVRGPAMVAACAALGVFSFNALSYLKFKSFDGAPLKYHVQYDAGRLAAIDGRNFHLVNVGFNFETYFLRPNFDLRPTFPYVFIHAARAHNHPRIKMDLADPIAAMPFTMPAIFFLAVAGGAFAFAVWPEIRGALGVIALAAMPMTLALLAAVAVSERYTADFCPPLILAAAVGLHALDLLRGRAARLTRALLVVLVASSIFTTSALTLHYQGEVVWGVDKNTRANYERLRVRIDAWLGLNHVSAPSRSDGRQ